MSSFHKSDPDDAGSGSGAPNLRERFTDTGEVRPPVPPVAEGRLADGIERAWEMMRPVAGLGCPALRLDHGCRESARP